MGDIAKPSTGVAPWAKRPDYSTYKSPYGPKYTQIPNIAGVTLNKATKVGLTLGAFGVSAGIFALFFFSDVPRFRRDVIQKIPIIGDHYVKEIPPSDNPY